MWEHRSVLPKQRNGWHSSSFNRKKQFESISPYIIFSINFILRLPLTQTIPMSSSNRALLDFMLTLRQNKQVSKFEIFNCFGQRMNYLFFSSLPLSFLDSMNTNDNVLSDAQNLSSNFSDLERNVALFLGNFI